MTASSPDNRPIMPEALGRTCNSLGAQRGAPRFCPDRWVQGVAAILSLTLAGCVKGNTANRAVCVRRRLGLFFAEAQNLVHGISWQCRIMLLAAVLTLAALPVRAQTELQELRAASLEAQAKAYLLSAKTIDFRSSGCCISCSYPPECIQYDDLAEEIKQKIGHEFGVERVGFGFTARMQEKVLEKKGITKQRYSSNGWYAYKTRELALLARDIVAKGTTWNLRRKRNVERWEAEAAEQESAAEAWVAAVVAEQQWQEAAKAEREQQAGERERQAAAEAERERQATVAAVCGGRAETELQKLVAVAFEANAARPGLFVEEDARRDAARACRDVAFAQEAASETAQNMLALCSVYGCEPEYRNVWQAVAEAFEQPYAHRELRPKVIAAYEAQSRAWDAEADFDFVYWDGRNADKQDKARVSKNMANAARSGSWSETQIISEASEAHLHALRARENASRWRRVAGSETSGLKELANKAAQEWESAAQAWEAVEE